MRYLLVSGLLIFSLSAHAQISIQSAASFRPEQPVCPGAWTVALGNFPGVTATVQESNPLPRNIAGVSVTVDGMPAAMNFAGPTQVNFIVPYGVAPGLRAVEIRTATATVTGSARVISTCPAIFPRSQETPPLGAIRNADATVNSSANPVRKGSGVFISIYGTGQGALTEAPPADGTGAPLDRTINTRSTPQVFIGGVPAEVQFSGLAPGFAGLWQINAFVPNLPFLSGKVPVNVFMDGVDANEVTVFVAQ